ncbi:MAG: hypothetical protein Kow0010_24430 [Dehalococcoidia bacterium]
MATQRPPGHNRARGQFPLSFVAAALAAVAFVTGVAAEEPARATIRVEGAQVDAARPGQAASPVVVALAPGETLTAFEIGLEFDPAVVQVRDTNPRASGVQPQVDGRWAEATITVDNATGTVQATGHAATPCVGPQPCPLFTLGWDALAEGATEVVVASFTLVGADGVIEDAGVVDAIVVAAAVSPVTTGKAAPSSGGTVTVDQSSDAGSSLMLFVGAGILLAAAAGLFALASAVAKTIRRLAGLDEPARDVRDQALTLLDQAERAGRHSAGGHGP